MTKTQIDKLGDRLRKRALSEKDIQDLDEYRRSFTEAYEKVVGAIRTKLALEPTGRPEKTTTSIVEKLRRESIRLSQIQDIAGCRIVVTDIAAQEIVVERLRHIFEKVSVIDRRERPSYGYRAVHAIVNCGGKLIEVQVRTALQHLWGMVSERFSDVVDPDIKYGGGHTKIREALDLASGIVADVERDEDRLVLAMLLMREVSSRRDVPADVAQLADEAREALAVRKRNIRDLLENAISAADKLKG